MLRSTNNAAPEQLMRKPLALALVATLTSAIPVAARETGLSAEWTIDVNTVRAVRGDPIELGADGGMIGDRVLIDMHRSSDNATATLTLRCAAQRYSITTSGNQPVRHDAPVSDWPIAATLLTTYCARIDTLPSADKLYPII